MFRAALDQEQQSNITWVGVDKIGIPWATHANRKPEWVEVDKFGIPWATHANWKPAWVAVGKIVITWATHADRKPAWAVHDKNFLQWPMHSARNWSWADRACGWQHERKAQQQDLMPPMHGDVGDATSAHFQHVP